MPYHRPPLSKEHLSGQKDLESIRLRPAKVYADNAIELLLSTKVTAVDRKAKTVSLDSGSTLSYQKLVLCTGANVREFSLAQGLPNVFYIRRAADTARLSLNIKSGSRAIVVGGGYIGLEAAAVLAQAGVETSVLEMSERILQRVTSADMSNYIQALHQTHGVKIHTAVEITKIQQRAGSTLVSCADGSEYAADFLIVGIGVNANSKLATDAGLAGDLGIEVNQFGQTADENIYAAGDCTLHPSPVYGRSIRLESVQNANDQARAVAANICGREIVYDAVPWFWSDQYKIKLQMTGLSDGYDEVVLRGSVEGGDEASFALFYLKQGVLIAADCVARPKEFMFSKQLIKQRAQISAARLQDEAVPPSNFLEK